VEEFGSVIICYSYFIKMLIFVWTYAHINLLAYMCLIAWTVLVHAWRKCMKVVHMN
jgi:hypothetical protein